jgi:transposase
MFVGQEGTGMFLRRYRRKRSGKEHSYYALVENARTAKGPRQRIVAYLGELNHDQERSWHRAIVVLNREGDAQQLRLFPDDITLSVPNEPDVVRVRLSKVGWTNARSFGDVWLGLWLWRLLKLDQIVERHIPTGRQTVRPADVVAIEVINRLCAPCSEFALAEHWYQSTALEDLLGVPDAEITKDRLYRTLDALLAAKESIEQELKDELVTLFDLQYDLLLYDLTSSYFEGLMEGNELARRGYSRDHRPDCKQIVVALVVTHDGFPLAHEVFPGNMQDVETVRSIVEAIERRFGVTQRVWVMDRGMISDENLKFLEEAGRRYIIGTRRNELQAFQADLVSTGWQWVREQVEVKPVDRDGTAYLLVRSMQRRRKERAIRKRQLIGLYRTARALAKRVSEGKLKDRDKILLKVGRLAERYPQAMRFMDLRVAASGSIEWSWKKDSLCAAIAQDGAYLLKSNYAGWTPEVFWQTYMQLVVAEAAFRAMKSDLMIRPIWHHYSGRTKAHVMVCFLAYALWRTLDQLAKRAKLETVTRKVDVERPEASPLSRPMSPGIILQRMGRIKIGDIILETTDGRQLMLRRVARPRPEQAYILTGLQLELPERLSPDQLL